MPTVVTHEAPGSQQSHTYETISSTPRPHTQGCQSCRSHIHAVLRPQDGGYCPTCCQSTPQAFEASNHGQDAVPVVDEAASVAFTDDSMTTSTSSIWSTPPVFDEMLSDGDENESVAPMTCRLAGLRFYDNQSPLTVTSPTSTTFSHSYQTHPEDIEIGSDRSTPPEIKPETQTQTSPPMFVPRETKRKNLSETSDDEVWNQIVGSQTCPPAQRTVSSYNPKRHKSKKLNTRRFGCPFSKHDPKRYELVHNACTAQPGLEWGRLMEHIFRVHSAKHSCIYCGQKWSDPNDWEGELKRHIQTKSCVSIEERFCKPECMTDFQEKQYRQESHDRLTPEEKWTALYMRLFPGEWPIPTPGYDFLVHRHRMQPEVKRSQSLPIAFVAPAGGDPGMHGNFCFSFSDAPGTFGDWTHVNFEASHDCSGT